VNAVAQRTLRIRNIVSSAGLFLVVSIAPVRAQSASAQTASARTVPVQKETSAVSLKVATDHPNALYHVGEQVMFTIQARQGKQPLAEGTLTCILSKDGWQPEPPRKLTIKDGQATLTSTLNEPGFLQLRVISGKSTALAGAGFDPLQLKPSLPVPDDFDQFWDRQKAELAKVPLKAKLTPAKAPLEGMEAFDTQIDCIGQPVSGYFGRLLNAKPKSLPAILFVHGAGVRSSLLNNTRWAVDEGGMLAMDINAHGIPNGQPNEFYTDLAQGDLKDYRSFGRADREKSYFKAMFLRMLRAIDFLTSQPEWDGKTLIVYGSSQGGFQALAAGGLDSRVTLICAGVPAGCDHSGYLAHRISGWPKLVPLDASEKPDAAILQASRYVDCVNFAQRAKCRQAVVTVGFIDTTCPPTSVYTAYNALPVPKKIHFDIDAGHTNTPAAVQFMQAAVREHVRAMKQP